MKVKNFFKLSAFLMIIASSIVSCTKATDNPTESNASKEIIVPLSFSGEIINMGTTPLSRATSDDLLYIQVYTIDNNGYYEDYVQYAHGLFDNTGGIKIALKEGKQYRFIATMVKDGKNRIYKDEYDGRYGSPFDMQITNEFVIDDNFNEHGIVNGFAQLNDDNYGSMYERPDIERYYGEGTYTVDTQNITPVDIKLMKTVFGVSITTENFTDGELLVKLQYAPEMSISAPNGSVSGIFSFMSVGEAYDQDCQEDGTFTNNYSESVKVAISRISNGETIPVDEQEIKFTRNMRTNLKVRIDRNMYENGVTVTTETEEMTDDGQDEIEFVGGGDF